LKKTTKPVNIFNIILNSSSKPTDLREELDHYLSTDMEGVQNVLAWWWEHCAMYPCLSRMALDYLSIPGKLLFLILNLF